jgi:hypothetical protein
MLVEVWQLARPYLRFPSYPSFDPIGLLAEAV